MKPSKRTPSDTYWLERRATAESGPSGETVVFVTPRRKASLTPSKPQSFSFNLTAGHQAVRDKERK